MIAFESLRPRLFAIAYRMLGSVMEAEDAVQETFLRTLETSWDKIQMPEAFLRKTIIHYCMDHLKSARVQRESYVGTWLPEPLSTIDPAEQAESLSMALLMLMENLSPLERAVFVLRETLDYSYAEIGGLLEKSEAACRKVFSRARQHLNPSAMLLPPPVPPEEHRSVLARLMIALQSGDVQALLGVLAHDVSTRSDGGGKVAAAIHPLQGSDITARFLVGLARKTAPGTTFEVRNLHGRENLVVRGADGTINTVLVFETFAGKVQHLFFIRNPDKMRHLE